MKSNSPILNPREHKMRKILKKKKERERELPDRERETIESINFIYMLFIDFKIPARVV